MHKLHKFDKAYGRLKTDVTVISNTGEHVRFGKGTQVRVVRRHDNSTVTVSGEASVGPNRRASRRRARVFKNVLPRRCW